MWSTRAESVLSEDEEDFSFIDLDGYGVRDGEEDGAVNPFTDPANVIHDDDDEEPLLPTRRQERKEKKPCAAALKYSFTKVKNVCGSLWNRAKGEKQTKGPRGRKRSEGKGMKKRGQSFSDIDCFAVEVQGDGMMCGLHGKESGKCDLKF